jgi:hypothetical protein
VSVLQSLKWIFWGVVLATAVGVVSAGSLNGVLGYAMIGMGMIGLLENSPAGRRSLLLKLVAIVSLLNAFWMPFAECPGVAPSVGKVVGVVVGTLNALAAAGFCVVMRRLCETNSLPRAEKSWRSSFLLWRVGLPASVAASCLSVWAVRNEFGAISTDNTPPALMIPLFVLSLLALVAWMHLLVSLWRTIAGLKGIVTKLPSASDFGLDREPPVQFSIRALLIVAAVAAILVAAGISQKTAPCWHLTLAALVGLGLLAIWLNNRALGKVLLIVVAAVLFAGYTQLTRHSQSDRICGTNAELGFDDAEYQLSDSFLVDIDGWLVGQGFENCQPPPDSASLFSAALRSRDLPFASEPKTAIWYRGLTRTSQGVRIRILYSKIGQYLHFVAVDYEWVVVDFPWGINEREKSLKQFMKETAAKWQEYLKGQRKDRPNP